MYGYILYRFTVYSMSINRQNNHRKMHFFIDILINRTQCVCLPGLGLKTGTFTIKSINCLIAVNVLNWDYYINIYASTKAHSYKIRILVIKS